MTQTLKKDCFTFIFRVVDQHKKSYPGWDLVLRSLNSRLITLAFSPHRIEVLPLAKELMEKHDVIILEEPKNSLFYEYLEGKVSIEEVLNASDYWFPEFMRESLKCMKELYLKGKIILQVEPYFELINRLYSDQLITTPSLMLKESLKPSFW